MSSRRARHRDGDPHPRRSRTIAVHERRQQKRMTMVWITVGLALVCALVVVWIYPKLGQQTALADLQARQLVNRSLLSGVQLLGVNCTPVSNSTRSTQGDFEVRVTCDVLNGSTKPVDRVEVTLHALTKTDAELFSATGEPSGFRLEPRASQKVSVTLTGLTRDSIAQTHHLELRAGQTEEK